MVLGWDCVRGRCVRGWWYSCASHRGAMRGRRRPTASALWRGLAPGDLWHPESRHLRGLSARVGTLRWWAGQVVVAVTAVVAGDIRRARGRSTPARGVSRVRGHFLPAGDVLRVGGRDCCPRRRRMPPAAARRTRPRGMSPSVAGVWRVGVPGTRGRSLRRAVCTRRGRARGLRCVLGDARARLSARMERRGRGRDGLWDRLPARGLAGQQRGAFSATRGLGRPRVRSGRRTAGCAGDGPRGELSAQTECQRTGEVHPGEQDWPHLRG